MMHSIISSVSRASDLPEHPTSTTSSKTITPAVPTVAAMAAFFVTPKKFAASKADKVEATYEENEAKKIAASKADKVEATYEENEAVDYEAKDGTYQSAVIMDVSFDDEMNPYYTIKLNKNGQEKGTVASRLRKSKASARGSKGSATMSKVITGALAVRRQMSAAARFLFNFATKGSATTMSKMITNARSWLLQTIVGKKRLLKNKMRILLLTKRLLRLKGSMLNTNT